MDRAPLKPLEWTGSSRRDLGLLPSEVRRSIGRALQQVQEGETPRSAKALKGFRGASVLEIVSSFAGDTYRAVYTVQFPGVLYVLHVFQKKSTHGIATPGHQMEIVRARLREARRMYLERDRWRVRERPLVPYGREASVDADYLSARSSTSTGNVFADLNLPNADELFLQSRLMTSITRVIRQQGMSNSQAAAVMGITEQEVDDIEWGDFDSFPIERLTKLLAVLTQSADTLDRPRRAAGSAGD